MKVLKATLCGTDLHILKGDGPTGVPGRVPGHEGVSIVEKAGVGVTTFRDGDRVRMRTARCAVAALCVHARRLATADTGRLAG